MADEPGGGFALEEAGFAFRERQSVAAEEGFEKNTDQAGSKVDGVAGDDDAGEEADEIPGGRREAGFIEIVDVEVGEPVVAFVGAEILEVEVAGAPGEWGGRDDGIVEVFVEEVTSAPEEREGAGPHDVVLQAEALWLPAGVEGFDAMRGGQSSWLTCFMPVAWRA